jgi:hypothetical protein
VTSGCASRSRRRARASASTSSSQGPRRARRDRARGRRPGRGTSRPRANRVPCASSPTPDRPTRIRGRPPEVVGRTTQVVR